MIRSILIIISILLFIVGLYFILKHQPDVGITTGTYSNCKYITDANTTDKFNPYSLCTVTYFVDSHTYKFNYYSGDNITLENGETVQIKYNPSNPEETIFDPPNYKNLGIICFVIMSILLLVLVLFFRK